MVFRWAARPYRVKILQLISTSHGLKQFHWNLYGSRAGIPWSTAWPLAACSGCSKEKWTEELSTYRLTNKVWKAIRMSWNLVVAIIAFIYFCSLLWRLLCPLWVAATVAEVCLAVQQRLILCRSQVPDQQRWSWGSSSLFLPHREAPTASGP